LPPNRTFKPKTIESYWVSNLVNAPVSSTMLPRMALRKPWTQAAESVMSSVSFHEAPNERVCWMIPGSWTLKSVRSAGIGLVLNW
jgi:hypothetical protein